MDHQLLIVAFTSQFVYITRGAYYVWFTGTFSEFINTKYMSLIFCFRFRVNQCLLHDHRKNIWRARPLETFIVTMICIFCFQNQTYFFRMPKSPELDLPKRHRSTYSNHIRLNSFCRLIGYLRLTNSGFLCKIEWVNMNTKIATDP